MSDILDFCKRYLAALERGATGDELAAFYTADAVQIELPNRLMPQGARRDLPAILEAAERGKRGMSAQRFELLHAMVSGNEVALEIQWTGALAVAFAGLPEGAEMRARFAVFMELREGRIAAQRNYDCFDPW